MSLPIATAAQHVSGDLRADFGTSRPMKMTEPAGANRNLLNYSLFIVGLCSQNGKLKLEGIYSFSS